MGIFNIFTKISENRELMNQGKILISNGSFNEAIECLTKVLNVKPNKFDALIARARAYCYIEEYDKALIDLNLSIDVNSMCSSGYFYRGQVNIIRENLYEAIDDFNNVIKVDKRNFLAYLKRGSIYSKLGIYDAAVNNFKALVRIRKRDSRYYDLLLSACLAAKNYKDLEKYGGKLVELEGENPRGYYYLGRMYAAKDNNALGVEYFTSALKYGGNNLDYLYHRGMSYVYLGKYTEAVVDFTLAIGLLNENGGEFYFSRGYSYLKLKEYENAIKDFDKSIKLKYNIKSCYYNKASAFINLKDYNNGIRILNKFIEEEKSFEGAYYDRGFCYKKLKEYYKAIEDYKKAIEINPKGKAFYYELSRLYFEIDDFDNVIKTLDSAEKNVKDWPYKTFSYNLKGDIYFNEKNNVDLAIKNYTSSISVSPTAYAYVQRGRAYLKSNSYKNAMEDYNRALEIEPENYKALYYKGDLNYYNGDINDSFNNVNASLSIKSTCEALILRGKCLFKTNRYSEAINDYTSAIDLDYKSAEGYKLRADAFKSLGMYEEAIRDYKRASQVNKAYFAKAYFNIGMIFSEKGKSKQAIYYYSKSLEGDSTNYIAFLKRGEELKKIGELDKAINDIENAALKLNKKDSYYNKNKEIIVETLTDISKKTISEQSVEKILRMLVNLEG